MHIIRSRDSNMKRQPIPLHTQDHEPLIKDPPQWHSGQEDALLEQAAEEQLPLLQSKLLLDV